MTTGITVQAKPNNIVTSVDKLLFTTCVSLSHSIFGNHKFINSPPIDTIKLSNTGHTTSKINCNNVNLKHKEVATAHTIITGETIKILTHIFAQNSLLRFIGVLFNNHKLRPSNEIELHEMKHIKVSAINISIVIKNNALVSMGIPNNVSNPG